MIRSRQNGSDAKLVVCAFQNDRALGNDGKCGVGGVDVIVDEICGWRFCGCGGARVVVWLLEEGRMMRTVGSREGPCAGCEACWHTSLLRKVRDKDGTTMR